MNEIDLNVLQQNGMKACGSNSSKDSIKVCHIKPNEQKVGHKDFEAFMHPIKTSDYDVKPPIKLNNMFQLLFFVMVICNGCLNEMQSQKTNLIWFEEWFLYFE